MLQNSHSVIEKSGRWLEPVVRSAESPGKCEPRCVEWEHAEWWIGKGTYSSRHEGLCLGLHVFDDCEAIRQSNQLKYARQIRTLRGNNQNVGTVSRVPGD